MKIFTTFLRSGWLRFMQFFENDATHQFDYRTLLGIYFAVLFWRLVDKVDQQNIDSLVYVIGGLQALHTVGLSAELIAYFQALGGSIRRPDVTVQAETVNAPVTGENPVINQGPASSASSVGPDGNPLPTEGS